MSKRAILYARVSTDDQAEKGYSLPSQLDAMRKYAAQQGFEVVGEFCDDYSGATPIEFRPEGKKAYALLQSGQADVIIAYTIDRYVRPPEDGDEWDMPILIRGLAKLGKEIHTVRRGKLNTNLADLLIALLDARKAGEERRDIRERSMRGKRAKAKSGRVIGGRAPYGYRHVRDEHGKAVTFEIDETTARMVRLIYQWCVYGDEHGKRLSNLAIALRLSEMGIPTPGEGQRGYRRKRGHAMWEHSQVGRILKNEAYAGVWRYGLTVRVGNTVKQQPRGESVGVSVPAIIDRETWERAQKQLERNKEFARRNGKREYLLSGLIRCGLCGMKYAGGFSRSSSPTDPGRRYYRDLLYALRFARLEERCTNKPIRADAIEGDIWDEIKELFQDLDKLWSDLKAAQQNADDQLKPFRDKLQITDDFIRQTQDDVARIGRALENADKDGDVYKSVKKDEKEVNARMVDLKAQREKYIKELAKGGVSDKRIETIMGFARKVKRGIKKAEKSFQAKRRMLEALGVLVTVTPGKYHLQTIVGTKDGEISRMGRDGVRIVPRLQM